MICCNVEGYCKSFRHGGCLKKEEEVLWLPPNRNMYIVLVGQDGAGKTSLAEAMLHVSGKTPRMGTTHDGKSYLDYD